MKRVLFGLSLIATVVMAGEHNVSYPKDYRNWTHLKSMVINESHSLSDPFEGIHHIYGNKKAVEGVQSNKYKKGAVFVFDLLEAKRTKDDIQEGNRKFIGVMEYDPSKYKSTGNWGFEAFAKDSKTEKVVKDGGVSCFNCHTAMETKGFVFSEYRK